MKVTGSAGSQPSLARVAAIAILVNLVVSGLVVVALRWPNPQPIRVATVAAVMEPVAEDSAVAAERSGAIPEIPAGVDSSTQASGSALIDINTASAAELESLPGIGPTLAGRIVRYRDEEGPFSTVEELMNVQGIGERTLDRVRGLITVR